MSMRVYAHTTILTTLSMRRSNVPVCYIYMRVSVYVCAMCVRLRSATYKLWLGFLRGQGPGVQGPGLQAAPRGALPGQLFPPLPG